MKCGNHPLLLAICTFLAACGGGGGGTSTTGAAGGGTATAGTASAGTATAGTASAGTATAGTASAGTATAGTATAGTATSGSTAGACGHGKAPAAPITPTCASGHGGDGAAAAVSVASIGDQPFRVASGDLDGDGNMDLALGGNENEPITVLFGKGDGTFGSPVQVSANPDAPSGASGNEGTVVIGDVNGDGLPDLVGSDGSGDLLVFLNNGNRTFGTPPNQGQNSDMILDSPAGSLFGIVAVDLNGDGQSDVVFDDEGIYVALSNCGTLASPAAVTLPTDFTIDSFAFGDFNGDRYPDLVVQAGGGTYVMLNSGNGTFGAAVASITDDGTDLAIGDVNKDGKLDILLSNASGGSQEQGNIGVLLGQGGGQFGQENQTFDLSGNVDYTFTTALADVNNDGNLDAVEAAVTLGGQSFISVALGNGDATFQAEVDLSVSTNGQAADGLAVADFNKDGMPDFAVCSSDGQDVSVTLSTCR